jgi:hypothetical protein
MSTPSETATNNETANDIEGSGEDGNNETTNINEGSDEEGDEWWEIKKVYSEQELLCGSPIKCDGNKCNLVACSLWQKLPLKKEEWNCCLDCQKAEGGFGGWPEDAGDVPREYISENHRILMAQHCSTDHNWNQHGFPRNLPFMERERRHQESGRSY